ncbi:MAG: 1-acyl-sn-glycerol-3-phosphate acyltransferase [Rhodocyclales bacterium]|nr:1-acyl-sn-glycerol-3-phosphate acyltransferase [Rhodocyclales bacterium]
MALHLLWGVVTAATAFPCLPERARLYLKSRWSRQLLEQLGVRIVGEGAVPGHGLLVANHISWLDIFAINSLAPATFLSKDDVLHWPVIGWLAKRVGTLFLERGSRAAAQRAKEHLIAELGAGRLVGVFPEGTTGIGDHVMPFHAALFQSAIDAGVQVMPALIRYTDRQERPSLAAAYVGETSLWECVRSIVTASGLTVRVAFLSAVDTAGVDRRHLAHHSHQLIGHALARFIPSPPVPPAAHKATGTPGDPRAAPQ